MTRVGWCPGDRTVSDMLVRYPGTSVVRVFVGPGKPIPAWDGDVLGPLAKQGVAVHLSFKTWDRAAVLRLVDGKPTGLPLILTFGHEPEQGPARGDLPLEQWRARWAELVALLAGHPRRAELLLAPVYTRYWWQERPGDLRWLVTDGVDAVGWDVYNNGSTYRTPDDLLAIPRQIAARTGLPYLIPELGAVRLPGDDGSGRQAWMRAMVDAARADGALTVCWFHRLEWDLTRADSGPEQQTWRDIIKEAPVVWKKGQPWRVVRSLDRLHEQIRAAYPRAVPPATPATAWGSIADGAHSTSSDHYPHVYKPLGSTAVVCARDFPHAPQLGLDAHAVAEQLRRSRDTRIGYIISDRRITGPAHDWRWDRYSGSDPHDTHIHVSTVHTAAADDPRDWQIGEDDDMTEDQVIAATRKALHGLFREAADGSTPTGRQVRDYLRAVVGPTVAAESTSPEELRAALTALPNVDPAAIAAAIPPELARQVADELAARLAS